MATDADKTPTDPILDPMDRLILDVSILQRSVDLMSKGFNNLESIKSTTQKSMQATLEIQEWQLRESKQRALIVSTCLACAVISLVCTLATILTAVAG